MAVTATTTSVTCNLRLSNGTSPTGKQLIKSVGLGGELKTSPQDSALYGLAEAISEAYDKDMIDVLRTNRVVLSDDGD